MLYFLFFFAPIYFFSVLKINTQQKSSENERKMAVEGGKLLRVELFLGALVITWNFIMGQKIFFMLHILLNFKNFKNYFKGEI